jgi:hypothetical protein
MPDNATQMKLERILVATGLLLLPVLWLQSILHQAPRFAGSLAGGVLGIAATLLMLVPLAYALLKRLPRSPAGPAPASVLRWHVIATTAGTLLAVVHSGHRVQSWLGLLLVGAMLLCLVSGYVGRHYLQYVARELRDRQEDAARLRLEYDAIVSRMADLPDTGAMRAAAAEVAGALADLDYAVTADAWLRKRLRAWLAIHVLSSVIFYALLAAHIWAGLQYGVRWLP